MGGTPRIRAIKVRRSYWTPQHLVLALSFMKSGESSQSRRMRGTKRRLPQERDNVFSLATRSSYIHAKETPERNFADPPPISTGESTPTPSLLITLEPSLSPSQNSRPTASFDCALLLNGAASGVLTEKSVVIDYTYTLVTNPEVLQANESEEIVLTAVEEQVNAEVMSSLTECEVADTGRLILQSQKYMNQDQRRRRTQIVDLKSVPNIIVAPCMAADTSNNCAIVTGEITLNVDSAVNEMVVGDASLQEIMDSMNKGELNNAHKAIVDVTFVGGLFEAFNRSNATTSKEVEVSKKSNRLKPGVFVLIGVSSVLLIIICIMLF